MKRRRLQHILAFNHGLACYVIPKDLKVMPHYLMAVCVDSTHPLWNKGYLESFDIIGSEYPVNNCCDLQELVKGTKRGMWAIVYNSLTTNDPDQEFDINDATEQIRELAELISQLPQEEGEA